MSAQAVTPVHLSRWAAGIAALVISCIAVGSLAISASDSNEFFAPSGPPVQTAVPADATPAVRVNRCAECGVIESMREIDTPSEFAAAQARSTPAGGDQRGIGQAPAKIYQTVVRRQDGSLLVINDVHPGQWRRGERVKLIGGIESPGT